jgi:hypothetical protein
MPRYDRTGPTGMGPKTGWGLGLCGRGIGLVGRPLLRVGRGLLGLWPGRRQPRQGLGRGLGLRRRRFW